MHTLQQVTKIKIKKNDKDGKELDRKDTTEYKSVLQHIRWPVSHVFLELAYSVSALAQDQRGRWFTRRR